MRKSDAIRLRHMLDAAQEAMTFAQGRARSDLDANRQLALSLVKEVEIIGEAAYQLSQETRESLPGDTLGRHHWYAPPAGARLLRYQSRYPVANRSGGPARSAVSPGTDDASGGSLMANATIDRLIINSPHEELARHWRYARQTRTFDLVEGRHRRP